MKENAADLVSNDVETPFLTPTSQEAPQQHSRKKPLTLLPLIALIFFEVSGGPFGTEVGCQHLSCHGMLRRVGCIAATAAAYKSLPGCGPAVSLATTSSSRHHYQAHVANMMRR